MERGVVDTVPAKMTSAFLVAESHRQEHTLPQVVTTNQGPQAFSTSPGASHRAQLTGIQGLLCVSET